MLAVVARAKTDTMMEQNDDVVVKNNNQATHVFKASKFWEFNVWGAAVAGICGAAVLLLVAGILLFDSDGATGRTDGAVLVMAIVATYLVMFPGNLIVSVPIAVDLNSGKGLILHAPLKKLFIPFEEIREVRDSGISLVLQQGIVVKLNKRYGLMKSFAIHRAYGDEGQRLARAIQQEISGTRQAD